MLNNKKDKLILLTIIFSLLLFVGSLLIDKLITDKKEYYLTVQSEILHVKYKSVFRYLKIMSDDIHTMYTHNHELMDTLKKAKDSDEIGKRAAREKAYNLLKRNYKRLKHMGISQIHFHTPDNKSFLRMYKPTEFGDDLSKIEPSVVLANRTLQEQNAFEACKFMVGLRFVYPLITAEGEHLGSVEIGFSTAYILKNITDEFVYDAHILVSKNIAKNTIIEENYLINYQNSWESTEYYIESITHKRINDQLLYDKIATPELRYKIQQKIKEEKPFSIAIIYNYQNIILTFLPLKGVQNNRNAAYIVTYTESDYLSNIEIEHNYLKILFLTVFILLYFFSIYVILNREKLKNLALYDTLTKLPNRTLFNIEFQNELNRAFRYNYRVALMFIDLDGFKAINDTYGHQAGDELLKKVANILTSSIRKTDIASRLSGDEFTVILPDIKNIQEAEKVAQVIINELNKDIIVNHKVVHIGASIGISIYPDHARKTIDLVKYADNMMYKSKLNGKNQVTLYTKEEKK